MSNEEIGKRLREVMTKLDKLGVFYGDGADYSGEYETKYPHSCYKFELCLDKHRSGFSSSIVDGCSGEGEEIAIGDGDTIEQLLTVLERSYEAIVKTLDNPKDCVK